MISTILRFFKCDIRESWIHAIPIIILGIEKLNYWGLQEQLNQFVTTAVIGLLYIVIFSSILQKSIRKKGVFSYYEKIDHFRLIFIISLGVIIFILSVLRLYRFL